MKEDKGASRFCLRITCEGDSAIRIQFGNEIHPDINTQIQIFCDTLELAAIPGVVEWAPAYTTIVVYYDHNKVSTKQLISELRKIGLSLRKSQINSTIKGQSYLSIKHIPVCYAPELGIDIKDVAIFHRMSINDVIRLHTSVLYRCYMNGFMPGFPYLGDVPLSLSTPRLSSPRLRVPAGSVGIAETQTGIYPTESPGGWRIIGRTPIRMYRPNNNPPVAILPGESIQFYEITIDEYHEYTNTQV